MKTIKKKYPYLRAWKSDKYSLEWFLKQEEFFPFEKAKLLSILKKILERTVKEVEDFYQDEIKEFIKSINK